jgi:hypothetical protein
MAFQDKYRLERKPDFGLAFLFSAAMLLTAPLPALCATCVVQSPSYPSVQSAVDNPACTEIILTEGVFAGPVSIGRTLEITGASSDRTRIVGEITVQGGATTVTLTGITIAIGPGLTNDGLVVTDGAEVTPDDLKIKIIDYIFFDGFDIGNTTAWSGTIPPP